MAETFMTPPPRYSERLFAHADSAKDGGTELDHEPAPSRIYKKIPSQSKGMAAAKLEYEDEPGNPDSTCQSANGDWCLVRFVFHRVMLFSCGS